MFELVDDGSEFGECGDDLVVLSLECAVEVVGGLVESVESVTEDARGGLEGAEAMLEFGLPCLDEGGGGVAELPDDGGRNHAADDFESDFALDADAASVFLEEDLVS